MANALLNGLVTLLRRWWPVVLVIAAWQVWIDLSGLNAIVMPKPLSVLLDMLGHPQIYIPSSLQTILVAAAGMLIGVLLGTGLAILAWYSPILGGMLTPLSLVFSSIPVVTVIPILARFFGYDMRTVIIIVGIISFFPAFVFTSAGLRYLPAGSADVMRVGGASRWRQLTLLALPAAVPSVMVALRIAVPGAILSAMLAEFLMGTSGLGYLFVRAKADFNMDRALGTSLVATLVSLLSFAVVSWAETRVRARWL